MKRHSKPAVTLKINDAVIVEDQVEIRPWVEQTRQMQPALASIQCVWSTRVMVIDAPSGTVYDFAPGETKNDVLFEDVNHLLSIKREMGRGCCGGSEPQTLAFFREA